MLLVFLVVFCSDGVTMRSIRKHRRGNREVNNQHLPSYFQSVPQCSTMYNQYVVKAEKVVRPLKYLPWIMMGPLKHSGVRVTVAGGQKCLIHKGVEIFARIGKSKTVVEDAKHLSFAWKVEEERPAYRRKMLEFIHACGEDYDVLTDNCHDCTERMMELTGASYF
ncbi:uncharacterized protein LOC119972949 isoform X1 [Scyliorhinus canicula]|uniref:uncharacterized protein LOC119972949 isoform X1 n=2 Tax=Scyliorhinus canicula TaxID=7830 RepID=UPI0018F5BDD8|nr:uncharacterized protein LOC119972949 isoform X1 [Scyliorhinus canicula]